MEPSKKNYIHIKDLKKRSHLSAKLGIDERDNIILSMIQDNPEVSQEQIAKRIKLSQPSVGARIRKLQQKGILKGINGVNFRRVELHLVKVEINATDTRSIIEEFMDCPYFINALTTSGRYNIMMLFTGTDLKMIEEVVNNHLRANDKVKELEMNVIISAAKDLVLPLNISAESNKLHNCISHSEATWKNFTFAGEA